MPRRGCRRAFPPRAPRLAVRDDFLHDRRSPASTGPPRGVPRRPADRRNRHAVKGRQRMKFSRVACSVVVAGLAATLPATHPVAAQEAPPAFGERVEVEVVNVDVVVTDASGRRITDLIREDFRLEVDGKAVPIDYFAPPGAPRPRPARGHRRSPGSRRSTCRAPTCSSSSIRAPSNGGPASRSSRRSAPSSCRAPAAASAS